MTLVEQNPKGVSPAHIVHNTHYAQYAQNVQSVIEALAAQEEPKEELVFNPVNGELEVLNPIAAHRQVNKPVMTAIARIGFFCNFNV